MTLVRRSILAFLLGVLLVYAVPLLLAFVAAAPGLAALIRTIRSTGFPLAGTYFTLTTFLPALLFSFGAGLVLFRLIGAGRAQLLAATAPWVLGALYAYADLCFGTPVSCIGAYDFAGLAGVPSGLLLAATVSKPPSLGPPSSRR